MFNVQPIPAKTVTETLHIPELVQLRQKGKNVVCSYSIDIEHTILKHTRTLVIRALLQNLVQKNKMLIQLNITRCELLEVSCIKLTLLYWHNADIIRAIRKQINKVFYFIFNYKLDFTRGMMLCLGYTGMQTSIVNEEPNNWPPLPML